MYIQLHNQRQMKKKKNENTGFPQRPAWLECGEEGSAIQANKILRNSLVAGIDPANEENYTVPVFKTRQFGSGYHSYAEYLRQYMNFHQPSNIGKALFDSTLDKQQPWPEPLRESWNPAYMENISLNGVEQTKEEIMKEMSEAGFLFVTSDEKDIRWAIDQLKKGEIVRNSAWPKEKIGIIMKVQLNPSADVKLITEGDVSFQYKFTNEDVLFGDWEIVK